MINKCARAYSN